MKSYHFFQQNNCNITGDQFRENEKLFNKMTVRKIKEFKQQNIFKNPEINSLESKKYY